MELAVRDRTEYLDYDHEYRVREDTITWLAEVLDGSMRVPTEFRINGEELFARDGSNLRTIFEESIGDAEKKVAQNPKLGFELRRRKIELDEYHLMVAMTQGLLPNTMVVVSDFPPELMDKDNDVAGYNTERKPTMLRVIAAKEDGIKMFTQSLDGTDREALEDVYRSRGFEAQEGELLGQRMHEQLSDEEQEYLVDQLMGVYDRSLSGRHGGTWRAGRRQHNDLINTYDFVRNQQDLVEAFVETKLKDSTAAEELRYSLAAAMERRFSNRDQVNVVRGVSGAIYGQQNIWQEMYRAGNQAKAEGKTYSGCGISSKSSDESTGGGDNSSGPSDLEDAGYGDEDKKENWKWKAGVCRVKECPTRPGKTKVGPCHVCVGCQHMFDKGRDPSAEYKSKR
jgi:hypothetical protein